MKIDKLPNLKKYWIDDGYLTIELIDNNLLRMNFNNIEKLKEHLTLTDVSSMFSAKQMEQAFNDGVEAEKQRCGEFNIENYY